VNPQKLSVNKIIETVMRFGDIDNRQSGAFSQNTLQMNEGAAAHRKIQKAAGEDYNKEVTLKYEVEIDGTPVLIHGRADGVIIAPDGSITIDEIKTTTLPIAHLMGQQRQHQAQAKVYAYMYHKTFCSNTPKLDADSTPQINSQESITIQLTYYQIESEEIQYHKSSFTISEIEEFFDYLIQQYGLWLRLEREWKIVRNKSITELNFPFETYRKGQREMAVAVYRVVSAKKKLYACAPTGIGKTLSALFPSIKAVAEDKATKIFYLTAKTVTRAVAEDAIRLMANCGLRFKSITLRAKDKLCPHEGICNPDHCTNAHGHFDRINDAIMDIIKNEDLITPDTTQEYAKKHRVCPHEFALDASLWCDLVICDYNHVFDPVVYLRRFFGDDSGEYVLLIDEAHNLADRVRDMYTATLRKGGFSQILNQLRGRDPFTSTLRSALKQINEYMKQLREKLECDNHFTSGNQHLVHKEPDFEFDKLISAFIHAAGEWLGANKNTDISQNEFYAEILNQYFEASGYAMIAELYDNHFTTIVQLHGFDVSITQFCIDPSKIIAIALERGLSSILFSATLTPLDYYREVLGGSEDDFILSLPSPFDPSHLLTITHSGISTKYLDRESSYKPIARAIYDTTSHQRGNYLVFFPSYEYMHRVYNELNEIDPLSEYPDKSETPYHILLQQNEMTEDQRLEFLSKFDASNKKTLIGFAVLGGIFSEGIDLKGDRLIGSIIVSVGLPKLSLRQDQIRNFFDNKNGQGYDYAYVYPGMNKVLQAAGRVIRSETDTGLVLLIDNRFASAKYRSLFPGHWTNMIVIRDISQINKNIQQFWK